MRFRISPSWLFGFGVLVLVSTPDLALAAAVEYSNANHAAPIASMSSPNYRAIIDRYGPAVVGVTVEGGGSATDMNQQTIGPP